jgi:hypothetical protein
MALDRGSVVLVLLLILGAFYARALNCGQISPAAPPEIAMLVCANGAS